MTVSHPDNVPDHPHYRLLDDLQKDIAFERVNAAASSLCEDERIDQDSLKAFKKDQTLKHQQAFEFVKQLPEPAQVKVLAALEAVWDDAFEIGYLFALSRTD